MSHGRPLLVAFLLVVVLAGVGAWQLTSSGTKGEAKKPRITTVGVATPVRQDYAVKLSYTADIKPYQQVQIFSRVTGYIAKVHVDQGDVVKAGQLLVEVDHTDFEQNVAQARANLEAARANVVRQQATLTNARLGLERAVALVKDDLIAQQQVDDARAAYDVAQAQLEAQRAQVRQAEVALQQAQTNLSYSNIRSPFSGIVSHRLLDGGAYVTAATGSSISTAVGILTVQDIERVRILLEVVEKDSPLVKVGAPAEVTTDAYPGRVFTGQVSRVVQALDPSTRTMTVEVHLPNPDRLLKGGMFARVDLKVGIRPDAILIPMDALTRLEELQYVYVVKDGKALQVPVEVGGRLEGLVEITQGLTGDEQVIVSGKDLVTTGKPVLATPLSRGGAPPPKDPSPKPRPKS